MKTIAGIAITIGQWNRDELAYDPSARVAPLTVDGETGRYTVTNRLGPGWYMHIYDRGQHIGMANWMNADQVAEAIERRAATT